MECRSSNRDMGSQMVYSLIVSILESCSYIVMSSMLIFTAQLYIPLSSQSIISVTAGLYGWSVCFSAGTY